MSEKIICPDDGLECIYPEARGEGSCFNCPKIQEMLSETKEVDEGGER